MPIVNLSLVKDYLVAYSIDIYIYRVYIFVIVKINLSTVSVK